MRYFLNKWMDITVTKLRHIKVFGDHDPIFNVIVLCVGYLLSQLMDFFQTNMAIPLGQA